MSAARGCGGSPAKAAPHEGETAALRVGLADDAPEREADCAADRPDGPGAVDHRAARW